ncbi:HAD family hydrolase [Patescibacteria group bacterium]|nr:HAD family hydrolase [Patescibacteria group bacterium]
MQVENLSRIELELLFGQWGRRNGIRKHLLDLDDTICDTDKVFKEQFLACSAYLARKAPQLGPEQWKKKLVEVNDGLFASLGVRREKLGAVMTEVGKQYSLPGEVRETAWGILDQIYERPIQMLPGAEEGLAFIKKCGVPLGIVTHGGLQWSWRKYQWLNMARYLDWDEVYVVDENGHKTERSWQEGCRYHGVKPEECCVTGNSPLSDINPALNIGVRHCFLVENDGLWSIHKVPLVKEVKRIPDLSAFIGLGAEYLTA